jgi:hypothetical protein
MAASSVIEKIDSGKKEYRQLDEQRDKNMQLDEYFSSVVQDARRRSSANQNTCLGCTTRNAKAASVIEDERSAVTLSRMIAACGKRRLLPPILQFVPYRWTL